MSSLKEAHDRAGCHNGHSGARARPAREGPADVPRVAGKVQVLAAYPVGVFR